MAILLNENDFCAGINYHSMGNIIYYGASTNTPEVAEGCKKMADLVHAINGYRKLMGATNPEKAEEGTLRKKYAESMSHNAVHGSDAPETAAVEVAFFFPGCDLV